MIKLVASQTRRVLALAATLSLGLATMAGATTEWGYHGDIGPEHWGSLDPAFATCDAGEEQSPIDIPAEDAEGVDALHVTLATASHLEVEHNGHTIEAKVPVLDGILVLDGKTYALVQFHFHAASEHTLDGEIFPMEMHLVHRAADGSLAVIGALVETGDEHQELAKIFSNLPQDEGEVVSVEDFDLEALLPEELGVYRYSGSLTTPDCREGVSWNVLAQPLEMSVDQIASFSQLFSGVDFPDGNRRPIQPLGDRTVITGGDEDDDDEEDEEDEEDD